LTVFSDFCPFLWNFIIHTLFRLILRQALLRLINVPLTDGQFDALVSFTYNLGGGALQRSTLRRKINREEHTEVPEQFMRWVLAGGRKLKGLVRRHEAEAINYERS
jgi:lysozyme